jgi:hypothetical protein
MIFTTATLEQDSQKITADLAAEYIKPDPCPDSDSTKSWLIDNSDEDKDSALSQQGDVYQPNYKAAAGNESLSFGRNTFLRTPGTCK